MSAGVNLADPHLFRDGGHSEIFRRLRDEEPVHLQRNHPICGTFWNITRHADILQVDLDAQRFSARDSFLIPDPDPAFTLPMFLAMDPPRHTAYRDAVKPFFANSNLDRLVPAIRARATQVLDSVPEGQPFDWVKDVAIEFTAGMLATIFGFPMARRHKLIEWSDLATMDVDPAVPGTMAWPQRQEGLMQCLREFQALHAQPREANGPDLYSLLVDSSAGPLRPSELLGNLLMLVVAGNDTTRNSISGAAVAFHAFPDQYALLRDNPSLLQAAMAEVFRWQTPIAYMRRVAAVDVEMHGRGIRAGEKVVIWYASGNHDERVFDQPEAFQIGRANAKRAMAFGFGIHRCLGVRLAELQLRILWEEVLARFRRIEVVGPPEPVRSSFIKGFARLPVVVHA